MLSDAQARWHGGPKWYQGTAEWLGEGLNSSFFNEHLDVFPQILELNWDETSRQTDGRTDINSQVFEVGSYDGTQITRLPSDTTMASGTLAGFP